LRISLVLRSAGTPKRRHAKIVRVCFRSPGFRLRLSPLLAAIIFNNCVHLDKLQASRAADNRAGHSGPLSRAFGPNGGQSRHRSATGPGSHWCVGVESGCRPGNPGNPGNPGSIQGIRGTAWQIGRRRNVSEVFSKS